MGELGEKSDPEELPNGHHLEFKCIFTSFFFFFFLTVTRQKTQVSSFRLKNLYLFNGT